MNVQNFSKRNLRQLPRLGNGNSGNQKTSLTAAVSRAIRNLTKRHFFVFKQTAEGMIGAGGG